MFLDKVGNHLYIGSSVNLNNRIINQHFLSAKGNLSKECIEKTHKVLFHRCLSKDDMKIKERYLINTLNPTYNEKLNNEAKFSFKLTIDEWEIFSLNKEYLINKRELNENRNLYKLKNHVIAVKNINNVNNPVFSAKIENFNNEDFCIYSRTVKDFWDEGQNRITKYFFIKINDEIFVDNEFLRQYQYCFDDFSRSFEFFKRMKNSYGLNRKDYLVLFYDGKKRVLIKLKTLINLNLLSNYPKCFQKIISNV